YVVFYINLRKRPISTYKDFLEVMFDVKYEGILSRIMRFLGRRGDIVNDIISDLGKTHGIPIPKGIFSRIFKEEKPENAFIYILNLIKDAKSKGKIPVLIIDELQVIGDLEVDGKLIYKLFNFFISLTKELHICHVFALSSDSLFIERVYNEAILKNRCRYLLVDDFDEKTAGKFLEKYGFTEEEIKQAKDYAGGKPALLTAMIDEKKIRRNINDYVEKGLANSKEEIAQLLYYIKTIGVTIKYQEKDIDVNYEGTTKILKKFSGNDFYKYSVITPELCYLVSKNILFVDTREKIIREILKEIETK
ncbi:MAG: ATP-binding protein, partial [Candidatus Altiarchaeales archaeon HGW-Altiarchaeales-2]